MSLMAPFTIAKSRMSSAAQSIGKSIALYLVLCVMAGLGVGFLIAALFIWLAALTDPLAASLLLGTGFLALSGLTLAIVIASAKNKKRKRRRSSSDAAMMASTMSLASAGLRIASRAKGPLLWPAIAAIAIGWYFSQSGSDEE